VQAVAIEAPYAENIIALEPELSSDRRHELDYLLSPRHMLDPGFEDAWFSRGETELAVQIVSIDRDPSDEIYLPEARSYRMPIAVGVTLASVVTALLVMF